MKILLIHNDYQQPGGELVAVHTLMDLLHHHGHGLISYLRDNREIDNYNWWQKALFFPNAVYNLRTVREVRHIIAAERPDVAHIHNVFPLISPAVYRVIHRAGIPIIQTVHNFRMLCPNALFLTHGHICERCKLGNTLHAIRWRCFRDSRVLSALYAATIGLHRRWGTFALIDHFLALTEFVAIKLVESGLTNRERVTVLGNFLPDPLPTFSGSSERKPYILFIGRLSQEKGVGVLLRAMQNVPSIQLKIAGSGPLQHELRLLAQHLKLPNVEFLGYITGDEKWQLLRQALATVMPSLWYENLPYAVLESLAVGTPVIASRLGTFPYVIEEQKNGLLFRPDDHHDLSMQINRLAANPSEIERMGRYGRNVVEQRYTATAHHQRLLQVYNEVSRCE